MLIKILDETRDVKRWVILACLGLPHIWFWAWIIDAHWPQSEAYAFTLGITAAASLILHFVAIATAHINEG